MKYLYLILPLIVLGGGIALARNMALRRSVVISLPIATLENSDYQIPPGTYRLGLHRWTKTGELVPILQNVPATPEYPSLEGRTGGVRSYILIHPGTRPEHSKGCILTSRENVEHIVQLIKDYENVYVTVSPASTATPLSPAAPQ